MDEAVKEINLRISNAKQDNTRKAYEDYKRTLREISSFIYGLVGKMRIDRVLDPPEIASLESLTEIGLRIGLEPDPNAGGF